MADELTLVKTRVRTATILAIIGFVAAAGIGGGWYWSYRNYAVKNREIIRAMEAEDIKVIEKNASYIQRLGVDPDKLIEIVGWPKVVEEKAKRAAAIAKEQMSEEEEQRLRDNYIPKACFEACGGGFFGLICVGLCDSYAR